MANSKPALTSAPPSSPRALAAQRWGRLEQGLPKVEHDECRRLMVKAIMAGESEKMDEALTEFRGLRSRLQLNGEWNHVLTFYGRRPGPETRKRVLEAQSSRAMVEHSMEEEPSDDSMSNPRTSTSSSRRHLRHPSTRFWRMTCPAATASRRPSPSLLREAFRRMSRVSRSGAARSSSSCRVRGQERCQTTLDGDATGGVSTGRRITVVGCHAPASGPGSRWLIAMC